MEEQKYNEIPLWRDRLHSSQSLKVDSHITSYMDDKFCDVAGCNNRATEIIQAQNVDGYFTFIHICF